MFNSWKAFWLTVLFSVTENRKRIYSIILTLCGRIFVVENECLLWQQKKERVVAWNVAWQTKWPQRTFFWIRLDEVNAQGIVFKFRTFTLYTECLLGCFSLSGKQLFHRCSVLFKLAGTAALSTLVSDEVPVLNMTASTTMITSANTATIAISPALLLRYSLLFFFFTCLDFFRKDCD